MTDSMDSEARCAGEIIGSVAANLASMAKSPLCLIYNAIVLSGGGIIYECAVITSSVLGIIKHKRAEGE